MPEYQAVPPVDFAALFKNAPNPYMILDPKLTIVAVNDAYCRVTMIRRAEVIGRNVFDVFPHNPDDRLEHGTGNLHSSLMRVLEYGRPDAMAITKYDIRRPPEEGGAFEERYWSPLNTPVLDEAGNVRWILHYAEDVTDIVQTRMEESHKALLAREQQRIIDQLRAANRELAQRVIIGDVA